VNYLLDIVQVTESNGLRLPREFALLVKQVLYFDRFLSVLAPDLDVMQDERTVLSQKGGQEGGNVVIDVD
jgi:aarF domain-containing kinase